jgi:phage/plasmid-like protein (TIGR03299 family)
MSANITIRKNGQVEMAAVNGVPVWWETDELKVNRVAAGASIETMRSAAGMDWKIGRSRVRYGEGENQLTWDDNHVLFRSDTKAPLGIVSPAYKIVQPAQIMEFFRDLTEQAGATLETAGTLFGGRRFWCMARLSGAEDQVSSGDNVLGYLLGITSADGSLKTTFTETTVCVVCNNTAQMALSERGARIQVGHRTEMTAAKMAAVKQRLAQSGKNFGVFMTAAKALAKVRVADEAAKQFVETLLRDQQLISAQDVTKAAGFNKIMDLFNGAQLGAELAGRQGTAWGLVNAVTEYVDHHAKTDTLSNAIDNQWFGRGDSLKSAAIAKALTLV